MQEGMKWCTCMGHRTNNRTNLNDYYSNHFLPSHWQLAYTTLNGTECERMLILNGNCNWCSGKMRSGQSIAANLTGDALLDHIYQSMIRQRPYDTRDISGVYHGACGARSQWYRDQDQLLLLERQDQFVALFHECDQAAARLWAQAHIPAPPVRRETATELFQNIVQAVKDNGDWPKSKAISPYTLPGKGQRPPSPELADYNVQFWPELNLGGSEGLYIDCVLYGATNQLGQEQLHIGSIRSGRTDRDACKLMGALTGALLYHANAYIKAQMKGAHNEQTTV